MAALSGGGSLPQAGAGTSPGQPPFGSSPMTAPVPNRGIEGEGLALVANALKMLQEALNKPGMGAETEVGGAVVKALNALGRVVPEGAVSPGMQHAGMQQFMLAARQQNPMQQLLRAQGQGGPPPGAPPVPSPGMPVPT